jgi:hypothetical protein
VKGAILTDGEIISVLVSVGVMVTSGVVVSPSNVSCDVGTNVSCSEDINTPSAKKQTSRYAAPVSLQFPVIVLIWILFDCSDQHNLWELGE